MQGPYNIHILENLFYCHAVDYLYKNKIAVFIPVNVN